MTPDEPLGNNNGSVKGHRYFKCPRGHGIFLRQKRLEVIPGGLFLPDPRSSREHIVYETEHELWSYGAANKPRSIEESKMGIDTDVAPSRKGSGSTFFITEDTPVLDEELSRR